MSYVAAETLALVGAALIGAAYFSDRDKEYAHAEPLPDKKEKVYAGVQSVSSHREVMRQYRGYTEAREGTYMRLVGLRQRTGVHLNPTKEHKTSDPVHDAVRGDGRYVLHTEDKARVLAALRRTTPGTHAHEYYRAAAGAALVQHSKGDRRPTHQTSRIPHFTAAY